MSANSWLKKYLSMFSDWKYVVLQEQCRLCPRLIHPSLPGMDFDTYGPAAKYFVGQKVIFSQSICQFCVAKLFNCQSSLVTHQYFDQNGSEQNLLIGSGAFFTDPIKGLIHRLKYNGDVLLVIDLAFILYRAWHMLAPSLQDKEQVILVPVPLHAKRMHQRGFNQAQLLIRQLAKLLAISSNQDGLRRIRNTPPQQQLNKLERSKNVIAAFKCKKNVFAGKRLVLLDDVCTSGATLTECAKTLLGAGAKEVFALTVACVDKDASLKS